MATLLQQLFLVVFTTAAIMAAAAAQRQQPVLRIACGSAGMVVDDMNREWMGDMNFDHDYFTVRLDYGDSSKITVNTAPSAYFSNNAPFLTSRLFDRTATYTFNYITPGRYFLRLWFVDPKSQDYNTNDMEFSILGGQNLHLYDDLVLSSAIRNMNPYQGYVFKEYVLNIHRTSFDLSFQPISIPGRYALVSGIELQPFYIEANAFPTYAKDLGTLQNMHLPSDNNYTYETIVRLNVGGQAVREAQDGLGRLWNTDVKYMVGAAVGVADLVDSSITYGSDVNQLTAPVPVYASARFMTPTDAINRVASLTWRIPSDLDFTYVIRLHFCELQYAESKKRVFDVLLNDKVVEEGMDVVKETGGRYVATVRDYHVEARRMRDNDFLYVKLRPNNETGDVVHANAILNGLEVYKGQRTPITKRRVTGGSS